MIVLQLVFKATISTIILRFSPYQQHIWIVLKVSIIKKWIQYVKNNIYELLFSCLLSQPTNSFKTVCLHYAGSCNYLQNHAVAHVASFLTWFWVKCSCISCLIGRKYCTYVCLAFKQSYRRATMSDVMGLDFINLIFDRNNIWNSQEKIEKINGLLKQILIA